MFSRTLLSLIFFLPFTLAAQQATPPHDACEAQPSQRDMNDCAAKQYQEADARLNRVFREAMRFIKDDRDRAEKKG